MLIHPRNRISRLRMSAKITNVYKVGMCSHVRKIVPSLSYHLSFLRLGIRPLTFFVNCQKRRAFLTWCLRNFYFLWMEWSATCTPLQETRYSMWNVSVNGIVNSSNSTMQVTRGGSARMNRIFMCGGGIPCNSVKHQINRRNWFIDSTVEETDFSPIGESF